MNGDTGGMFSNGNILDTLFKGAVALGGTLLGAITMFGGGKIIQHEKDISALHAGTKATEDSIGQLRATDARFEERFAHIDEKLDRILDRLPEKR